MTDRIHAVASFFDEVRFEVGGKVSLMGQYIGEIFLADPVAMPMDRLAIVAYIKWPMDTKLHTLRLRVDLPRQEPLNWDFSGQLEVSGRSEPNSPFASHTFQTGMNLRLAPLQPGDVVDVWLTANDEEIPAGRLYVRLHPPVEVQDTSTSN